MSDLQELIEETLADVAYDVSSVSALDADQRGRVQETARLVAERVTLWVVDAVQQGVDKRIAEMAERIATEADDPAQLAAEAEAAVKKPDIPDLATVWAHGATTALQRVRQGLVALDQAIARRTPSYQKEGAQAVLRQAQAGVGQLVVDGARRKVDRPRRQA